ncbi:MAG: hypothetical protein ACODAU_11070 [Myxococcota bacterium]
MVRLRAQGRRRSGGRGRGAAATTVVGLLCLGLASPGAAQYGYPNPYSDPEGEAPPDEGWPHPIPMLQVGAYVTAPTFLTDAAGNTSTGIGIGAQLGIDLGFVVPEVRLGWQYNDIDSDLRFDDAIYRTHVSVGLKLEGDNASVVTPFLGGTVDFNWWSLSFERQTYCNAFSCWSEPVYRFAPGLTGRAGLSIAPLPGVSIDLGVEAGMSFEGEAFADEEVWLGPYLGITGHI